MKNKRAVVLWEHTWAETYDMGCEPPHVWNRAFRMVGWSWEYDEGARRLGAIHYEELTEDCMGDPIWRTTDDEHVPAAAMAALLVRAGVLPNDADLTDVTG